MQTRFKEGQLVMSTKLDKLQLLRQRYYDDLIQQLEIIEDKKYHLVIDYKNTVKDIDKEIEIERHKMRKSNKA